MAMILKDDEERVLMARVRLLLKNLADAWDPAQGGEAAREQYIDKNSLKEAQALSNELGRFR